MTERGVLRIVLCKEKGGIMRIGFLFSEAGTPVGELFEEQAEAKALPRL